MKTKKLAASLPLLAGIALGIASLAAPFLMANHYIYAGGATRYSVDNYLFFLWGKYYTVVGTKQILSATVMYDFGDFPIYAMIMIITALVIGSLSLFSGRGLVINAKGKILRVKMDVNPLWFQATSLALLLIAYTYLGDGAKILDMKLLKDNYEIQNGILFDFLLGSIVSFTMSSLITGTKHLQKLKNKVI